MPTTASLPHAPNIVHTTPAWHPAKPTLNNVFPDGWFTDAVAYTRTLLRQRTRDTVIASWSTSFAISLRRISRCRREYEAAISTCSNRLQSHHSPCCIAGAVQQVQCLGPYRAANLPVNRRKTRLRPGSSSVDSICGSTQACAEASRNSQTGPQRGLS